MIIFLNLKCFAVFSLMGLLNGYLKKILPLEVGGGGLGVQEYIRCVWGGERSKHICMYD